MVYPARAEPSPGGPPAPRRICAAVPWGAPQAASIERVSRRFWAAVAARRFEAAYAMLSRYGRAAGDLAAFTRAMDAPLDTEWLRPAGPIAVVPPGRPADVGPCRVAFGFPLRPRAESQAYIGYDLVKQRQRYGGAYLELARERSAWRISGAWLSLPHDIQRRHAFGDILAPVQN